MTSKKDKATLKKLDSRLVAAAKDIKILTSIAWPVSAGRKFLNGWDNGSPKLPVIKYPEISFTEQKRELKKIAAAAPETHPIGVFIKDTAKSYIQAAQMIESRGKKRFTELSKQVYGSPKDAIGQGQLTHLKAAKAIINLTKDTEAFCAIPEAEYCITPDIVVEAIKKACKEVFTDREISVVIDDSVTAKAAAGRSRIRIRASTCFSDYDIEQLIEHECFVHTLTAINGREQFNFKSFSLGAPRTTRTQEGLAVFAELITTSIDVRRLRRIALRVAAIERALAGENFIDIFSYFLKRGISKTEAFQSASRIFRGGNVKGKIAFTKDAVYLAGLTEVHTFLRKAISSGKLNYPHYLFAGRLTLSDILNLEECFTEGLIDNPRYEPPWIKHRPQLVAFLTYSSIINRINLGNITLEDFRVV